MKAYFGIIKLQGDIKGGGGGERRAFQANEKQPEHFDATWGRRCLISEMKGDNIKD